MQRWDLNAYFNHCTEGKRKGSFLAEGIAHTIPKGGKILSSHAKIFSPNIILQTLGGRGGFYSRSGTMEYDGTEKQQDRG